MNLANQARNVAEESADMAGDERQAKLAVAIKAVLDYGTPEVAPFTTTTVTSAFAAPASVST